MVCISMVLCGPVYNFILIHCNNVHLCMQRKNPFLWFMYHQEGCEQCEFPKLVKLQRRVQVPPTLLDSSLVDAYVIDCLLPFGDL